MAHQPIKPRTYVLIYVALLLLTATTVYVARYMHLEKGEIPVALGIASVKTLLVGIFFMHLIYSRPLTWMIMIVGVLFLFALITITLSDYWTRGWTPVRSLPPAWLWL
jgi:cytochrome c oxidase subunit 4